MENLQGFTDNEFRFASSCFDNSMVLLEWGAGGSTVEFAKLVKTMHTIEHHEGWYNNIKNKLQPNSSIYHAPIENFTSDESDDLDINNYITYPDTVLHLKPDAIFIDGVYRFRCAEYATKYITTDTIVLCHDWHCMAGPFARPSWKFTNYYDIVKVVDNLVLLKLKE